MDKSLCVRGAGPAILLLGTAYRELLLCFAQVLSPLRKKLTDDEVAQQLRAYAVALDRHVTAVSKERAVVWIDRYQIKKGHFGALGDSARKVIMLLQSENILLACDRRQVEFR